MGLFDGFGGGGSIFGGGSIIKRDGGGIIKCDDGNIFGRSTIFSSIPSPSLTNNLTGGEAVVIGGIVAAVVAVAKWLFDDKAEEAKTEGMKEGYEKASREYEAKLRKQAKAFRSQIEAIKKDIESLKKQRDKAMKLVEKAVKLLGEFEGCINSLKEKDITPDDKTIEDYEYLSDFVQQLKDAKAA